ncbi:MAG: hypothetical protein AAFS10_00435 [Myxococcota bacterium]
MQIFTLDVFEDHVGLALSDEAGVDKPNDVGVFELGNQPHFTGEARPFDVGVFALEGFIGAQHLDGDKLSCGDLLGLVDHAEPTATQDLQRLVASVKDASC